MCPCLLLCLAVWLSRQLLLLSWQHQTQDLGLPSTKVITCFKQFPTILMQATEMSPQLFPLDNLVLLYCSLSSLSSRVWTISFSLGKISGKINVSWLTLHTLFHFSETELIYFTSHGMGMRQMDYERNTEKHCNPVTCKDMHTFTLVNAGHAADHRPLKFIRSQDLTLERLQHLFWLH